MFLSRKTVIFVESYSGLEDTFSWLYDDKNGAYYLWINFLSSFIDMSLLVLIEWIDITYSSSSILSKLIWLLSHVWSTTPAEFWWHDISLLILLSSVILSFILVLDSVSVYFCTVMSLFNELLVWTLIRGMFEFPITSSLFDVLELSVSLPFKGSYVWMRSSALVFFLVT